MNVAQVVSLRVGRPRTLDGDDPWSTSIFKEPVHGRVFVRAMNIDGDEQADLTVHGGRDKAVCVYSAQHYAAWRKDARLAAMADGAFGENLTVQGQTEADVCIGDQYAIGDAVLEVSQPRTPCWKVSRRWNAPDLPRAIVETGRTGWYLRVVREGEIGAGDVVQRIARPYPGLTIERVNDVLFMRTDEHDDGELAVLVSCDKLARGVRLAIARRAEHSNNARNIDADRAHGEP